MLLAMVVTDDLDLAALFCTMRKRGGKWFRLRWSFMGAVALACMVAACTVPVTRPPVVGGQAPDGFPISYYQQLSQRGSEVLQIDPAQSSIVIEVRRAGSLANLGHDHVVASHDVRGFVAPGETRADFYVRLDQLVVDEPALRAEAAFETQPSKSAISGTRENMLRKFNAEEHPYAVIAVTRVTADATAMQQLETSISLNGVTRTCLLYTSPSPRDTR